MDGWEGFAPDNGWPGIWVCYKKWEVGEGLIDLRAQNKGEEERNEFSWLGLECLQKKEGVNIKQCV